MLAPGRDFDEQVSLRRDGLDGHGALKAHQLFAQARHPHINRSVQPVVLQAAQALEQLFPREQYAAM
eukprot:gene22884-27188_t